MSICLLKKCRQVLKILIFYVVEELMAKNRKGRDAIAGLLSYNF